MDQIHFGKPVTGDRALYSISGLVEDSGAIISGSGFRFPVGHQSSWSGLDIGAFRNTWAEHALFSISGWLRVSGATISISGTRGLKGPLFYFRSFGAKMG